MEDNEITNPLAKKLLQDFKKSQEKILKAIEEFRKDLDGYIEQKKQCPKFGNYKKKFPMYKNDNTCEHEDNYYCSTNDYMECRTNQEKGIWRV